MEDSVSEPAYIYWAVVVDELLPPPPELRSFSTLEDLADFIKQVHRDRKSVWVLPFCGDVLGVTEGGVDNSLRFLVDPMGARLPLFDTPDESEEVVQQFYPVGGKKYLELLSKALESSESNKPRPTLREPPARRFEFVDDDEDDEDEMGFDPKAY